MKYGKFARTLTPKLELRYQEEASSGKALWIYPSCCDDGSVVAERGSNAFCSRCGADLNVVKCPPRCAYNLSGPYTPEDYTVEEWFAGYLNCNSEEVEVSIT